MELNPADRHQSVTRSLVARMLGPDLLQAQVDLARRLQQSRLVPRGPAAQVSLLGSGSVVLVVLCAVLWRAAPYLGWLPTTAAALVVCMSGIAKAVFKGPRPYWWPNHGLETLDPTLEVSYGFPSGHTSAIGGVYALLADRWRHESDVHRARAMSAVLVLVAVIAFSRVFTAAHFVHDVAGGAVTGGLVFLVASAFEDNLHTDLDKAAWLMGASFFTLAVVLAQFPPSRNIPFKLVQESMSGVGFCWGLAVAHVLEAHFMASRSDGRLPYWACALGIAGILVIHKVNKSIYHAGHDLSRATLMLCCSLYSCIILWALYLLPLIVKQNEWLE